MIKTFEALSDLELIISGQICHKKIVSFVSYFMVITYLWNSKKLNTVSSMNLLEK